MSPVWLYGYSLVTNRNECVSLCGCPTTSPHNTGCLQWFCCHGQGGMNIRVRGSWACGHLY